MEATTRRERLDLSSGDELGLKSGPGQASVPTEDIVVLKGVSKEYAGVRAVDDVDLRIGRGEFFTILGPSGSGKTTVLRMIAGLIEPSVGEVLVEGKNIVGMKPYERNISMVFQSLALFPHMTVAQNIAFPLRMRKYGRSLIQQRIREVLDIVRLPDIQDRAITELSGGQRQRVAIARALVYDPSLLLLDEPLGALDRRLREDMQLELARLHAELNVTILNVTHDQREALMLSDRMAVMDAGRVMQVGTSRDLYGNPSNRFVASFLGDSVTVNGTLVKEGGEVTLIAEGTKLVVQTDVAADGREGMVVIRSENLRVAHSADGLSGCENVLVGKVTMAVFEGGAYYLETFVPSLGATMKAAVPSVVDAPAFVKGSDVYVGWRSIDCPVVTE